MVIGIDLDGVLFDTEDYFRTYAMIFNEEHVHSKNFNLSELKVKDRYGWDFETNHKFFDKNLDWIEKTAPIRPFAIEAINKLHEMGHKLVCITARGFEFQEEIDITKKRLKKAKIKFDEIIFEAKHKLETIQNQNIDIMIEDNPDIVDYLSQEDIKCIYLHDAGIKQSKSKNVIEVFNWAEIYLEILKLQKTKSRVSSRAVIIENNKVLTLFRRKISDGKTKEYYVIPGGGVEAGESLEETVKRELFEELSLNVEVKKFLGKKLSEDKSSESNYFECKIISGSPKLSGPELLKNCKENYYEPVWLDISKLDSFDLYGKEFIVVKSK